MREKLLYQLVGYAKIRICGKDKSRLLNLSVKNSINFWNYKRDGEDFTVYLRLSDYKNLVKLRKNLSVKIRIIKKSGLPLFAKKWHIYTGYLLGIILCAVLYLNLSGCYWVIETPENGLYTRQQLLEISKEVGIFVGAKKSEVVPKLCALKMLQKIPEIRWITFNTDGCKVDIQLNYNDEEPYIVDKDGVGNVVAKRGGVISYVEAEEGMVEVKKGEGVKEGDVLITGIWDSNRGYEEWEQKDEPIQMTAKARGKVFADTNRYFCVTLDKNKTYYEKVDSFKKYSIGFFGIEIPFVFELVPSGDYRKSEKTKNLWLFGTRLPIYLTTETLTKVEEKTLLIDENEAKEILEKMMEEKILETIGEDGKILSEIENKFSFDGYFHKLEKYCLCNENIAIMQEIATN